MSWVLNHSTTSGTEKLILVGIASHADREGRNAWPTLETLATYASSSVRTVQRLLPKLAKEGHLVIRKNRGGGMEHRVDRRPNLYEIVMHEVTASVTPDPTDGVTSSRHPVDASEVTTGVTSKPSHGVTKEPPRGDKNAPRGDSPVLKTDHISPSERPLERPKSKPSLPADADRSPDELFALDDEPGPGNPVQTLVGAYADAIKSAGGIPTSRRLKATGKNVKRLITEDHIPLPILLVAVQRAGTAKSLDLDRFLGDVQQTYDRGGKSRRSLIESWAAKYGQQPNHRQIGA